MNVFKRITLLIAIMCFIIGCSHIPIFKAKPVIGSVEKPMAPIENPISDSMKDRLMYETSWIRYYATQMNDLKVKPTEKVEKIVDGTVNINDLAKETEVQLVTKDKQIEQIKGSEEKASKRIWLWVIGVSALMVMAGSVLAFLVNVKMGLGLGLSGVISFIVAYVFMHYAWLLGLIGILVIILAVILCICYVFKYKTALIEVVKSFEFVKEKSFSEVSKDVGLIQSKATKAIVKEIKDKHDVVSSDKFISC